jgi:hypothetical protein
MRDYEVVVILDPELEERTVAPSLDTFLNVVKKDGGTVRKVESGVVAVWHMKSTKRVKVSTPCLTSTVHQQQLQNSTVN